MADTTVVVGAWGRRTGDGGTVCGRIGGGVTNFSTAAYPAFNMHLNVTPVTLQPGVAGASRAPGPLPLHYVNDFKA